jgi:hypothetical protein
MSVTSVRRSLDRSFIGTTNERGPNRQGTIDVPVQLEGRPDVFLGTIRNVTVGRGMASLQVFDDAVVVTKGDLKGMVARIGGTVALGGRGFRVGDALASRSEQAADDATAMLTSADLAAADPANRRIALADVTAVRYTHPMFPPIYRLDIQSIDGRTERFEWKRLHNEPKDVADLLRRAVGDRLTTERI